MAGIEEAEDRRVEVQVCARSVAYFVDTYGVIDDAQDVEGGGGGVTAFRLWPAQMRVMRALAAERLLVILKARQLGISWCCCGYVLWLCLFRAGREVLLFSRGKLEAKELLRRTRVLYERLPVWMRAELPGLVGPPNTAVLTWSNGSRVMSMASTPTSGVSFTASCVVMDEAAKMAHGEELYETVKPTIDAGGQLIVLSTANGFGGLFHTLWDRAVRGISGFRHEFLGWWERPGRDGGWYRAKVAEATDPGSIPQEYPANPLEAFRSSGRARFAGEWVAGLAGGLADPMPEASWPASLFVRRGWAGLAPGMLPATIRDVPGLSVYRGPEPGRRYLLAADVAEGREARGVRSDPDYDAAVVLDAETWEECASLHGRWEPDKYAEYLMALSEPYRAEVIVERNNHGHAVLAVLRLRHFPRIGLGHDGYEGWLTNVQTKPPMIDLLAAALRDGLVTVRTEAAAGEMQVYATQPNGRTGAPHGFHDDWVMAWAIGLAFLQRRGMVCEGFLPVTADVGFKLTGMLGM
jgi:hypothetical protein